MTTPGMAISAYNNGGESRTAGYMPVFGQENRPSGVSAGDSAAPADSAGHTGFYDILKTVFDIVNPLQHIPVVGAIYRHMTGDEPAPMARLAGDGLYGGPIGAFVGFADIALKKTTGRDMGERAFAMLDLGKDGAGDTMLAQNTVKQDTNSGAFSAPAEIVWDEPAASPTAAPVPASKDGTARIVASAPLLQHSAPKGKAAKPIPSGPTLSASKLQPTLSAANAQSYFLTNDTQGPDTAALAPQKAPQAMIAAKMMEALDKYGAMKSGGLAPSVSGDF